MKIRPFFVGLAIGAAIAALSAVIAIHGNNLRWEREAYDHFAGVYTFDAKQKHIKLKWMWIDDYVRSMPPKIHATPSPSPEWKKI